MNIGFVGPFGDINFGDYAMLVNNIYAFGQQDYTVFTYNYELICELKQTYLKNYTLSEYILKVKYGYCNKETDKYHVEYDTYAYTPLEILNTLENKAEIENAVKTLDVILSRLVDTFISKISLIMLLVPKSHNTVYVLTWVEDLRLRSRSSGCSNN